MEAYKLNNNKFSIEEKKGKAKGLIIALNTNDKKLYAGKAQRELYNKYGDPRVKGWGNKWMVIWKVKQDFPWFPAERIYIHKDFRLKLRVAFSLLETSGLYKEIKSFDGCYVVRMVRGTEALLSVHSWGCAIDINAHLNPLGAEADWSRDFITVMETCGIYCGSRWKGRPDPMHFGMVDG